jgi:uncharacterized surface protein with fasciclin (FAS1) repeats
MQRRRLITLAGFGLVGLGLAACGGGGGESPEASGGFGVLSVARGAGAGRFARAFAGTELAETLAGPGPFTLFAPTDQAFAAAGANRLSGEDLVTFLAYHVVPGELSADYMEGFDLNHTTLSGRPLNVDGRSGLIRVGGVATVTRPDLPAANGVVHVIDQALTPR